MIKKAICTMLILFLCCMISYAAPAITSHNNTESANDYMNVDYNTTMGFNATSDEDIVTWTWTIDDVDQSNNASSFNNTFDDPYRHIVGVYGTNANGSTDITYWYVTVNREMSTTTSYAIDIITVENVTADISGTTDPQGLLESAMSVFTNLLGAWGYLLVYGIVFYYTWNKSETIVLPTILFMLTAQYTLGVLPESAVDTMIMIAGIAVMNVFYFIFGKDSR